MEKDRIILRLQKLKAKNSSVPEMLDQIAKMIDGESNIILVSMQCFREAFDLPLRDVSPIGGWKNFGGELSDKQLDDLIRPYIYE